VIKSIEDKGVGGIVRVRFAPSPTGDLHVGGVRTALFNYLYARHTDGRFLLRIEDTDRERSTPEAVQVILDGLAWLGLDPDEEIVYQSRRMELHRAAALELLERGGAYRCFCAPEELTGRREEARRQGRPYKYDRRCLHLPPEEVNSRLDEGRPYAVRLKVPEGEIRFQDGVHGEIRVSGEEIEDFVLLRRDGSPTYMLAVVVDDADMGITHIIRGDDHISNTPKQILLYRALDRPQPEFAHVPLILGTDKKRLSKRHGATSITHYREAGYLPETMINCLGLLGWSPGDDRNVINRQELTQLFDISGIQSSGAVFDEAKLQWLSGQYISGTEYASVSGELGRFAEMAASEGRLEAIPPPEQIETAWNLMRSRIHLLSDLFDRGLYMFRDPDTYEPKGVRKYFSGENIAESLSSLAEDFDRLEPFNAETTEKLIRARAEEWGLSAGKLIHPVRLAVSGVTVGPGLFELLEALGQETVVRRIRHAANEIQSGRPASDEAMQVKQ